MRKIELLRPETYRTIYMIRRKGKRVGYESISKIKND
jgi:hypothetical protein